MGKSSSCVWTPTDLGVKCSHVPFGQSPRFTNLSNGNKDRTYLISDVIRIKEMMYIRHCSHDPALAGAGHFISFNPELLNVHVTCPKSREELWYALGLSRI